MFLDNPNNRIKITDEIRTFIIEERSKRNLSANQLSKNMERPQSWIAQIENGRTQSIKQKDLVFVFSVILNSTLHKADEYLMDNLIKLPANSVSVDETKTIDKQSLKQLSKYNQFTKNETEEEFKKQKRFIIEAINSMYEEVPEEAVKILRTLCRNMNYKLPFIMGVSSLPFFALKDLDEDVSFEVYTKIADLLMEYANKDKERIKRIEDSEDEDEEDDDWDEEDEDEEED